MELAAEGGWEEGGGVVGVDLGFCCYGWFGLGRGVDLLVEMFDGCVWM